MINRDEAVRRALMREVGRIRRGLLIRRFRLRVEMLAIRMRLAFKRRLVRS